MSTDHLLALKAVIVAMFIGMAFGIRWGHKQRTWHGGSWGDVLLLGPLAGAAFTLLGILFGSGIVLGAWVLFQ